MRTNWFFPPPLTSTSTTSMPSERATRCAISSMRDDVACRIMNPNRVPAQQKSGLSPTRQVRHSKNYCTTDGEECKLGGINTTTPNEPDPRALQEKLAISASSTGSTLQELLYSGWGEMQVGWNRHHAPQRAAQ